MGNSTSGYAASMTDEEFDPELEDPHGVKSTPKSFGSIVVEETAHWLTSHIFALRLVLCVAHAAIAITTFIELAHLPLESVFSSSSIGVMVDRVPQSEKERYNFNSAILLAILHIVSVLIAYPFRVDGLTDHQKIRRITHVRMVGFMISMPMIILFISVVCGITDVFAAINLGVITLLVHFILVFFEVNAAVSRSHYLNGFLFDLVGWSILRLTLYLGLIFPTIWASFALYESPEQYIQTLVILVPILMAPIPVLPLLKQYFPLHPNYWEIAFIVVDFTLKGAISLVFGIGKKHEAAK